jgi:cytochrome c oxidase subunit 4
MATTTVSKAHHVVPIWMYALNLVALLVLMFLTVFVAQVNLPGFLFLSGHMVNNLVALIIATTKAVLVIMIFMGVRWSSSLVKLWVIIGFTWFTLMFLILVDYGTRKYEPTRPWEPVGDTALPREAHPSTQKIEDDALVNVRPRQ